MDSLQKAYLIIYNVMQTVGWTLVLAQTMFHLIVRGTTHDLYDHTHHFLNMFQTLAVLEIVHCATGLVRSNVVLTTLQVFSREFLVWAILFAVPEARLSIGLPLLIISWSVTEIIRYSYYAFQLVGAVPYVVLWCRYTFFYILYPSGVGGELFCIFAAINPVCQSNIYSLEMPNRLNVTFSYCVYLYLSLLVYAPGFPKLYFHMISQRGKALGGSTSAEKKHK